jgi:hypothetical protein
MVKGGKLKKNKELISSMAHLRTHIDYRIIK